MNGRGLQVDRSVRGVLLLPGVRPCSSGAPEVCNHPVRSGEAVILDAFIIEEIRRREREAEQRRDRDRPRQELPLPERLPVPYERHRGDVPPEEPADRGVVIIDYAL